MSNQRFLIVKMINNWYYCKCINSKVVTTYMIWVTISKKKNKKGESAFVLRKSVVNDYPNMAGFARYFHVVFENFV